MSRSALQTRRGTTDSQDPSGTVGDHHR